MYICEYTYTYTYELGFSFVYLFGSMCMRIRIYVCICVCVYNWEATGIAQVCIAVSVFVHTAFDSSVYICMDG